jgi:hypothetical protein
MTKILISPLTTAERTKQILDAAAREPSATHVVLDDHGHAYLGHGASDARYVHATVGGTIYAVERREEPAPAKRSTIPGTEIARVYVEETTGPTSTECRVLLRDGSILRATGIFGRVACQNHTTALARALVAHPEDVALWPERWEAAGRCLFSLDVPLARA